MFSVGFRRRFLGVLTHWRASGTGFRFRAGTGRRTSRRRCASRPGRADRSAQASAYRQTEKEECQVAAGKSWQAIATSWLDQDVRWIITDEERSAFKQLSNDEERENFIEAFWQRRDPTPDTAENEFKEEHYRRIAYANEHFPAGIPGWKTDRGRIYIVFGPPDEIESHPSGGTYERPMEEGGGTTSTFPFEQWRYRYIEDIGQEVIIEFVDTCMCGDYHMTIDRSEKDALLIHAQRRPDPLRTDGHVEQGQPVYRWRPGASGHIALQSKICRPSSSIVWRQFAKLNKAPAIKFKDLENELVTTRSV